MRQKKRTLIVVRCRYNGRDEMTTAGSHTGFVQKSDCGFLDFSRTKLLLFPDFSRHYVHLNVNINITELALKR